jgi:hypothetical protein
LGLNNGLEEPPNILYWGIIPDYMICLLRLSALVVYYERVAIIKRRNFAVTVNIYKGAGML